jgi:hypothetical protein
METFTEKATVENHTVTYNLTIDVDGGKYYDEQDTERTENYVRYFKDTDKYIGISSRYRNS